MHESRLVGLAVVFLMLLCGGTAMAGVPCAGTSTVAPAGNGPCAPDATVCPAGDLDLLTVTVVVRDCYGTPLAGLTVTVYPVVLGGAVCICPGEGSKTVGPTDATGTTYAYFSRFGGCGQVAFYGEVSTVVIGPSVGVSVVSPDIDGDCTVNLVDFGAFALSYLSGDPCCDFDCDGIVNLVDFGTFALHYLHACGPQ